ncbi:helicase-like protein [Trypanosoma grayi]|uniref:helicase-like protein n=1 Tax=Trypanosoma grayi TaxID=71804 RepID=UPI0004F4AE52|nr:helicase-like protein [Trypanosoma grayi]KEG10475.1 helicase-like protein [Trypanosoma grayi]
MDDPALFVLSSSDSGDEEVAGDDTLLSQFSPGNLSADIPAPRRAAVAAAAAAAADSVALSMEEVLFGDTAVHRRAPPPPPPPSVRVHDSDEDSLSSGRSGGDALREGSTHGIRLMGTQTEKEEFVDMAVLRSMTCADVRAVLEPFFQRNELARVRFDQARSQLAEAMTENAGKVNRNVLERWRRLVNISNWGDGTSTSDDVLFPEVLLPPVSDVLGVPEEKPSTAAAAAAAVGVAERQLRPHQLAGIRFIWSALAEGPVGRVPAVGCILAHTMGLGKTCQVVVFLHLYLCLPGRHRHRVLLVVPKSTRSGWRGEFAAWSQYFPLAQRVTPAVIDERDSPKRRADVYSRWRKGGGVLLVGYEMLLGLTKNSAEMAVRRDWTDLLICDEAHRLKSARLQIVTALRGLHPLRRLLLTGTPLQNHLQEYWAMVDFAVHKYFERRRFQEFFINPIEASVDKKATPKEVAAARMKTFTLIRELRHFVQRVDSAPLQHELPPLHEYVVVVPLSPMQVRLYNQFLRLVRVEQAKFNFLQAAAYANKISAHPQLLFASNPASPVRDMLGGSSDSSSASSDEGEGESVRRTAFLAADSKGYMELCESPENYTMVPEDGAKLYLAMLIIKAATLRGEKTLLFSLSTKLLDLFECIIAEMNRRWQMEGSLSRPIRFCRLDGSNSGAEREDTLNAFCSANGADVFLLSMKAGGVGITITAATRVILADSGFNPADDRQAIGRAYRYGQTRPVFVYRLVCHHTLEHRMFEQKVAKEWLFHTVVEEASLKRDALAGLRLQSMFQLLSRTRAVSSEVPMLTDTQRRSTALLTAEDSVLADVAGHILYAESHADFLQHDEMEPYGNEERAFYEEYQKTGVFNVDGGGEEDVQRRRRQREEHQQDVAGQAKTLTALVDDIIRTRSRDDPQLRHLLRMMGITVDETGAVAVAAPATLLPQLQPSSPQQQQQRQKAKDDSTGEVDMDNGDGRHRKMTRTEATLRLRPVVVDDSEDDLALLTAKKNNTVALVDPSKYEPFRPGRDSASAILIDEEEV